MPDSAEEALERVLQSLLFKKADRQSRFLRHIVEKHLAGDDDALRETSIGLEVYDRPASYDPKTDPIVRVEASRLRSRLREYYESEGAEDSVRIQIPKGSYVPVFDRQPTVPLAASPVIAPPVATSAQLGSTRRWLLAAGLTVLLAGALAYRYWAPPSSRVKQIDAIAVLPFLDLSEKRDLAFAANGLTEQMQDELGRIRDLRIVGSTSAKLAAANPDLRAAARQIGVDALIEGSIRTEDKKLRVAVRLIDGANGSKIWAGTFDGERSGLFELEERIAQTVAEKLSIQLAVRREGVDVRKAPQRAQAHEYYQKARALAEQESAARADEIYRLYRLSAHTDPSYAPAHAALASVLIQSGASLVGDGWKAQALDEMRQAMTLDPQLPRAYAAQVLYYRDSEMNWAKAREACSQSLRKFPNSPALLTLCATVEGAVLNRAKAVELVRRAIAIDPLSPQMHAGLMFVLYQSGQFQEAMREADAAVGMGSKSKFLYRHRALILAAMGKPLEGLKELDEADRRLGGVPADWMPIRGYLLGLLGRKSEAERLLSDFTRQGALPHHLGFIYLGLGDKTRALAAYEKQLAIEPSDVAHAIPEYYMRTLDGEPRFEAMKRKLSIPTL